MPFDLNALNSSTRFYWGDTQEEYIDLRVVPEKEFRRMNREMGIKDRVEYVPNPQTGQMHRIEYRERNDEALEQLDAAVNDYCIAGWRLVTPDGDEIPCTRENKLKLIEGSPEFSSWLNKCLKQLRGDQLKAGESEQKN